MLYGSLPFEAFTMDELKNEVVNKSGEHLRFHSNVMISNNAKDLLIRLLQRNPDKRIGWIEFFEHPIFGQPSFPDSLVKDTQEEKQLLHTSQLIDKRFESNKSQLRQFGDASALLVMPDPLDLIQNSSGEFLKNPTQAGKHGKFLPLII